MFGIVNRQDQKTKEVALEGGWKAVCKKGSAGERSVNKSGGPSTAGVWPEQRAKGKRGRRGELGHGGPRGPGRENWILL